MTNTPPQTWDFRHFLATPPPNASFVPFHIPSEEEEEKLARLIAYFGREGYVPPAVEAVGDASGGEKAQVLSDWEMMFLSREGIIRFLVATRWNEQAAIQRLEKCLAWRRKTGIDDVQGVADKVEAEYARTGGQIILGWTEHANPVIVMQVNKRDTPPSSVGLLQLERLAIGAMVNIPWVINLFLQAVYVFLDPVTKSKLVLNPSLRPAAPTTTTNGTTETTTSSTWPPSSLAQVIPPDQLLTQYGGARTLDWNEEVHERYWKALVEVSLDRRERAREKWALMGGGVGRSEFEFKKGE
ncbi:hypothetical protein QFC22_005873 [Naganishia vaughanmartiniae]|uniref:Uncharacterized protein n=1 Tax=Naganishia vaughanmartiniae TaxID=1424756 RepID=A0ACC2WQK1_9TREE|nr:hypothetical protein QFC22_005873 [Naganishia vaughanmartiniae]